MYICTFSDWLMKRAAQTSEFVLYRMKSYRFGVWGRVNDSFFTSGCTISLTLAHLFEQF